MFVFHPLLITFFALMLSLTGNLLCGSRRWALAKGWSRNGPRVYLLYWSIYLILYLLNKIYLDGRTSSCMTKIFRVFMRPIEKPPGTASRVFSLVDIQSRASKNACISHELLSMNNVLGALTFGQGAFKTKASKHRHIPYRDGKLTRLFQVSSSPTLCNYLLFKF